MIKKFVQYWLDLFYPLFKKFMPYQFYAYLSVGAVNTLLNILLFVYIYRLCWQIESTYAQISISSMALEIATSISFLISAFTGFWLNKNFAFTESSDERKVIYSQFGKYFMISAQGQLSDYLITKTLTIVLLLDARLAYLSSTFIMITLNYFLQKYYTFRAEKA